LLFFFPSISFFDRTSKSNKEVEGTIQTWCRVVPKGELKKQEEKN